MSGWTFLGASCCVVALLYQTIMSGFIRRRGFLAARRVDGRDAKVAGIVSIAVILVLWVGLLSAYLGAGR